MSQMNGCIWTHISIGDRRSCCATGIRVDIAKKYDIGYAIVSERLIVADGMRTPRPTCRRRAPHIGAP